MRQLRLLYFPQKREKESGRPCVRIYIWQTLNNAASHPLCPSPLLLPYICSNGKTLSCPSPSLGSSSGGGSFCLINSFLFLPSFQSCDPFLLLPAHRVAYIDLVGGLFLMNEVKRRLLLPIPSMHALVSLSYTPYPVDSYLPTYCMLSV